MEPELSLHDWAVAWKHKQRVTASEYTGRMQQTQAREMFSSPYNSMPSAHWFSGAQVLGPRVQCGSLHSARDAHPCWHSICILQTNALPSSHSFFFFKFPPSHTRLNMCTEQTLCLCIVYISNTCVHWYFVYHWKCRTRTGAGMSWLVPYSLLQVVRLLQSAPTHLPHVHQNVLCFTRDRHLVI